MIDLPLRNLEIRDFVSGASLLVSGTSLLVSLFTAYWNILRGAKLVSSPFRWVALTRIHQTHTLIINFPISITNIGSQTGIIDCFYIDFLNLLTHDIQRFYAWQEGPLVGQNAKEFREEIPVPIALKAGESIIKYYSFCPHNLNFMYECGLHKISLYAYLNSGKKPVKLYERQLEIESIVEPGATIYSYKLLPTDVLKVSNYN